MESIERIVRKMKMGDIIRFSLDNGYLFVGYFDRFFKKKDPEFQFDEVLQPRLGFDPISDQYKFTMYNPRGSNPPHRNYGLQDSLPEFYVTEDDGGFKVGSSVITQGQFLKSHRFRKKSFNAFEQEDIESIVRLTLPGRDNMVVGQMVGFGNQFLIIAPSMTWVPIPLAVADYFDNSGKLSLNIPLRDRIYTSKNDTKGRLIPLHVNTVRVNTLELYVEH